MKMTQGRFERLPLHNKHEVYCTHEHNMIQNPHTKRMGLSLRAQTALCNDWLKAFWEFQFTLPRF